MQARFDETNIPPKSYFNCDTFRLKCILKYSPDRLYQVSKASKLYLKVKRCGFEITIPFRNEHGIDLFQIITAGNDENNLLPFILILKQLHAEMLRFILILVNFST